MDVKRQLHEKMSKEYDEYIEKLKQLPAEEIIRNSQETLYKEEILNCVMHSFISELGMSTLLTMDHPLDTLYKYLEDSDAASDAYVEFMVDIVKDAASSVVRENIDI